ncbi:hypothetical protein TSTA_123540 [Talaromyces stipitatus ATCC 10500]|uniref:MYND-type zinc finger protein samB n=1 Tax=Talaromyces stipitatus (strain ATCC 10500 / CBS 375.48 / QM 6759 / NRRL 1006) TaxID=441959 RepID=B8MAC1_TALSN|nr:uncharacterized protein TSTA_123540 [Talaromyces stipitatus ATCC 10500]EED18623.1 hypothetical protein TSTA_123540 [Talaromyces stipitatus ATCC 10500]
MLDGDSGPNREPSQTDPLSLKDTLQLLGATLNNATVKDALGSKWSIGRTQAKFAALHKEKPRIHAEIRIVLNLFESNELRDIFPYSGCSKKSCTMCWHFVQITSRHGEVEIELERERVTATFSRLSMEEDRLKVANDRLPNRKDEPYHDECYSCGALTLRKYSVCNRDFYCSKACEEKRNSYHLFFCAKIPLTPADYLFRDVLRDRML